MEDALINLAHCLRLKYHGPTNTRGSRYSVAWDGWMSEGPRVVRKFVSYDSDTNAVTQQAVALFLDWINDRATRRHVIEARRITRGMVDGDYFVLVETQPVPQREGEA